MFVIEKAERLQSRNRMRVHQVGSFLKELSEETAIAGQFIHTAISYCLLRRLTQMKVHRLWQVVYCHRPVVLEIYPKPFLGEKHRAQQRTTSHRQHRQVYLHTVPDDCRGVNVRSDTGII